MSNATPVCPNCREWLSDWSRRCPSCNVPLVHLVIPCPPAPTKQWQKCPVCDGTGRAKNYYPDNVLCNACAGRGMVVSP